MKRAIALLLVLGVCSVSARAQSTSIGKLHGKAVSVTPDRATMPERTNAVLNQHSLIAVKLKPPKLFKPNDLITIIVREQTIYEAEGITNNKRKTTLKSELDSFLKFTGGGIGAAIFRRGKPNIGYKGTFDQKSTSDSEREDKLTTRITAIVVDVKPNGNLVLEAYKRMEHGDDAVLMTVTGTCRSADVTPDNTILSTQLADQDIRVTPAGTIRNATRQGWLGKVIDRVRPL